MMTVATRKPHLAAGFSRRVVPFLVGVGLLSACGATTSSSSGTSSGAITQTARPTSAAIPNAVFAFETAATSPERWTFTDSNGTVLHTFTSTSVDGTSDPLSNEYGYVGGSNAILARSNSITPTTRWRVIHADGTSTPVASSLTPILNGMGFPGDFLAAPSTLYMVEQFPNRKNPFKFYELDLATGAILKSDSLVPLSSTGTVLFEPENIDVSAHLLSFLIANTTFEHVRIGSLSVVTLDLSTNGLAVHPLSSQLQADIQPPSGIAEYETNAYVSGDGSLLTYQTPTSSATYILDLKTGQTVSLAPALSVAFIGGQNSVYYSPTDHYAALIGSYGSSGSLRTFVVNTSTGALVKDITPLIPAAAVSLQLMDWAGPTQVVYATNDTMYANTERTYLLDVRSGQAQAFVATVGQFIAVLP
jgi:hypothetical protein